MAMKLKTIKFDVYIFNALNCDDPVICKVCNIKDYISQTLMNLKCESQYLLIKTQIKYDLLRIFFLKSASFSVSILLLFRAHFSVKKK